MGGRCHEGEYWDGLLKQCLQCHLQCQQPRVNGRCISYCGEKHTRTHKDPFTWIWCLSALVQFSIFVRNLPPPLPFSWLPFPRPPALESAHCKAVPGHFYDRLLKKCMWCADVCGRHPAECSQHCRGEYWTRWPGIQCSANYLLVFLWKVVRETCELKIHSVSQWPAVLLLVGLVDEIMNEGSIVTI